MGLCTLAREERGSALTIFAVVAPIFILFLAIALDVGNWYSHKRQLQNRADAGVLAAGVEYQKSLIPCITGTGVVQQTAADAIAAAARGYSGDPTATGTLYNLTPTNQGSISVAINSTTFGGTNYSDGAGNAGNPCYLHPVDASDWISPAGGRWTDVKVKETNIPTFFGTFGINVPAITARARLQVGPALSDNQFIPVGVPDAVLTSAQARFFNGCLQPSDPNYYLQLSANGNPIGNNVTLTRLADQSQAPQFLALWGTPGQNITFQLPTGGACVGDYIPVGMEVRAAGLSTFDLNALSCAALHQASAQSRYADCWSDPAVIRAWRTNPQDPATQISFHDVNLFDGSGTACSFDPHLTWNYPYSGTYSCGIGGRATVNWGDRVDPVNLSHATYTITLNGASLTPPATPNGVWQTATGVAVGASGAGDVVAHWHFIDSDKNDTWIHGGTTIICKSGNTPCDQSGDVIVHRTFTATDTYTSSGTDPTPANFGILKLLQVTTGGTPGTGATLFDTANTGTVTPSLTLNVGLQAPFDPTVSNGLSILRAGASQGNQALNCSGGSQGDDFADFAVGCTPFYTVNEFMRSNTQNNPWWYPWSPPTLSCPRSGNFPSLASNNQGNPWLCVPTAPGNGNAAPSQACGLAKRTGNAPGATGPGCKNDLNCLHPNRYTDYINGTDPPGDPRVVKVFVIPFGAFKGLTGGDDSVPLYDFGAFYVTAWNLDKTRADPCIASPPSGFAADVEPPDGQIVGHFVKWAEPNNGPIDTTQDCNLSELRPCRTALVR